MIRYVKEGWDDARKQPFLLLALFVYRFAWGIALYRIVQGIAVPLLHRYPGKGVSADQVQLFLAEGQFRLMKTDLSHSTLWLLIWLLLAKMALTPLLNAGVYFSIANAQYNAGYRFFRGIAELGKSFSLYYLVRMALTLAPLYWLAPKAGTAYRHAASYEALARELLPYAAAMLLYGYLLHLFFMYVQFGRAWSIPLARTLGIAARSALPLIGIAASLLLLGCMLSATVTVASLVWAGFWALLLYQAFRIVETMLSLWSITSQHRLYQTKALLL